jgi:pyruvate/2-oxoglutarate dehydrogenase complex dihydrolipoamide acyltransferase (E2) component
MTKQPSTLIWLQRAALCGGLLVGAVPAHAGLFDSLFGGKPADAAPSVDPAQRIWRIGEFTTVQLVPAEPGAAPNQHPFRLGADVLRWQFGGIRTTVGGKTVNLFGNDEINEIAEPLAQAFALAGPGDDVLLISSSRRGASFLTDVTAVTARLFVQDGSLQFVVRDTRLEFVKEYISSRNAPKFSYGSRALASKAAVTHSGATSRRADWLALGLTLPGAAPAAATAAQPAPAAAAPPAAPAQVTPAAAPAAAAPEPLQTELEHRLATLKRLRDRGLISEEEFQEKRKEVLKQL